MYRLGHQQKPASELLSSKLFDEKTFYEALIADLEGCCEEIIIESPYITTRRAKLLTPIFRKLRNVGVNIYVMTRDPKEHDITMEPQSEDAIRIFETIGVQVLMCVGNHHRKLAILDRKILWEGSLNILSQTRSREIMRRIESKALSEQMFNFLNLEKFL